MSNKTILHMEDNASNRKIVRDLLSNTSYRLIEAADGELGIALALKELPDLILMDVQMPKVSGPRTFRSSP
jgi:CheY-like chemotaxis protein